MFEDYHYACTDVDDAIKSIGLPETHGLSYYAREYPLITICCEEEIIEYPEFVYITSCDDIDDTMDNVMIDSTFIQNGTWNNVTTVMYNGSSVRKFRTSHDEIKHICQIDFDGIDTLYINKYVGCTDKCFINCNNIIFVNQIPDIFDDFCVLNATIIRFDHDCFSINGKELINNIIAMIEDVRFRKDTFNPADVINIKNKNRPKNKSSKKKVYVI